MWAMMQKLRIVSKPGSRAAAAPVRSYTAGAGRGVTRPQGSELQDHLHHVVLVAVGIGAVAGDEVAVEAQAAEGADGVGFEVGDQHAGQVAQPVVARDA